MLHLKSKVIAGKISYVNAPEPHLHMAIDAHFIINRNKMVFAKNK